MLEITLSTINGTSIVSSNFNSAKVSQDRSIIRRSNVPIGTV